MVSDNGSANRKRRGRSTIGGHRSTTGVPQSCKHDPISPGRNASRNVEQRIHRISTAKRARVGRARAACSRPLESSDPVAIDLTLQPTRTEVVFHRLVGRIANGRLADIAAIVGVPVGGDVVHARRSTPTADADRAASAECCCKTYRDCKTKGFHVLSPVWKFNRRQP